MMLYKAQRGFNNPLFVIAMLLANMKGCNNLTYRVPYATLYNA